MRAEGSPWGPELGGVGGTVPQSLRGGSALMRMDLGSALHIGGRVNLCSELPGVWLGGGHCWGCTRGPASSSESGAGSLGSVGTRRPHPGSDADLPIRSLTPQLYELDGDPKRKEFLDDLFSFMQKRGEAAHRGSREAGEGPAGGRGLLG